MSYMDGRGAPGWLDAEDSGCIDRELMESLLLLSSSEPARQTAATWLAAFDAARLRGAPAREALDRAREACGRA